MYTDNSTSYMLKIVNRKYMYVACFIAFHQDLESFIGSLREQEMLWKHKEIGDCFHSFFEFFQTPTT